MNISNLPDTITNKKLKKIAVKVFEEIPVSKADAVYMLSTNDILELGKISNFIRTKLHGHKAYYGVNMNLNFTNICELRCPLCAFSRDEGDKDAFLLSLDEIGKRVRKAVASGIDEVHIVGGLHPELKIDYFEEMIRRIKKIKSDLFIVAFTAVEIDYFAKKNKITVKDTLKRLTDAGVGAMPGGGAEIFSPRIRNFIAPTKIPGRRWLQIMRTAHEMGLKTNATMLYNHKEEIVDIADHLAKIRKLQDETGGFKTFVPLLFHAANTRIKAKRGTSTGYDDIRIYAASRIFLHNVPHLKALWMYLGDKMAQVLLRFGVDDFAATYYNEKVVHAAGAKTPDYGSEPFLKRLIENAGLKPVRTTANYWIQ
ncbi:MAG: CofH family radical SAM protein [Desulfobacteraceae bacterium]|nr:MAG: CofH family radical SAM protein [Desulfobacteraceae bacterium]